MEINDFLFEIRFKSLSSVSSQISSSYSLVRHESAQVADKRLYLLRGVVSLSIAAFLGEDDVKDSV